MCEYWKGVLQFFRMVCLKTPFCFITILGIINTFQNNNYFYIFILSHNPILDVIFVKPIRFRLEKEKQKVLTKKINQLIPFWHLTPEEWNHLLLNCIIRILSTFNFRPHICSRKLLISILISSAPFSMSKIKTMKSLALCGLIVGNEDLIYYIWDFPLFPLV
jgi:hypothetical protein